MASEPSRAVMTLITRPLQFQGDGLEDDFVVIHHQNFLCGSAGADSVLIINGSTDMFITVSTAELYSNRSRSLSCRRKAILCALTFAPATVLDWPREQRLLRPGEQRAAKVNDLFAAIARRYDLLNDLQSFGLHRRWKRRVVELAAVQPGDRALDLCCGTGDIAFALAQRGAEVTGLDFSPQMLEIAEARSRKRSRNPESQDPIFIQGDAQQIPFPDALL